MEVFKTLLKEITCNYLSSFGREINHWSLELERDKQII